MSEWYYRKQGLVDDSTEGPLSDAEFLQLAYDGKVKLDTHVTHPKHTKGQWVTVGKIPAACKKLEEGAAARREAKEIAVAQNAQQKAEKKAAAAELKHQRQLAEAAERQAIAVERQAKAAREQEQAAMLTPVQPIRGDIVAGQAPQQAPIVAPTTNVQTSVVVQNYRPFNHTLHFVLTLITCGVWFPIWVLAYVLHK